MGFFETYFKVWEVRTSIRIQERAEEARRKAIDNAETQANIPKIVDELFKKNLTWNEQIELARRKSKNDK